MLRATYEAAADWAVSPQSVKPIYSFQTQRDCKRNLQTLPRRLRDRMVAARMAYPFLKEAETGETPELPAGIKRLSLNQMAELVLSDIGHADPENVETRIWRPSRSVIHLARSMRERSTSEKRRCYCSRFDCGDAGWAGGIDPAAAGSVVCVG
jgi:hypothetical protein